MESQEKYNSIFAVRLREQIELKKTTITALSKSLGITRQAVSQYADGTGQPNVDKLLKIADYFGVSADYLIGLSDIPTRNETIQGTHNLTGLWQDAIATLKVNKCCDDLDISDFISYLVVQERLPQLIHAIKQKNSFSGTAHCHIDIDEVNHEIDMAALFKLIVSDLFFEIIDSYTAKPDEIMLGHKEGKSNG